MLEKIANAFLIGCMFVGIAVMAIVTSGLFFGILEGLW